MPLADRLAPASPGASSEIVIRRARAANEPWLTELAEVTGQAGGILVAAVDGVVRAALRVLGAPAVGDTSLGAWSEQPRAATRSRWLA